MAKCIECKKRPIYVKKRGLCSTCYQRLERKEAGLIKPHHEYCTRVMKKNHGDREVEFVKNYFDHKNFVHHPATFRLNGFNYSPDFYDGVRNVFIEVSGTRQAYHVNKEKYAAFEKTFPKMVLEIRKADGQLLEADNNDHLMWK